MPAEKGSKWIAPHTKVIDGFSAPSYRDLSPQNKIIHNKAALRKGNTLSSIFLTCLGSSHENTKIGSRS